MLRHFLECNKSFYTFIIQCIFEVKAHLKHKFINIVRNIVYLKAWVQDVIEVVRGFSLVPRAKFKFLEI